MKYKVMPRALRDLEEIDDWVHSQFGATVARRVQKELFATFQLLADSPGLGREREEFSRRPVRFYTDQRNWIIYLPGELLKIYRVYPAMRRPRRF